MYLMLTRANYTAGVMKMKVNMQAHGVWEAINPKDPKITVVEDNIDKTALTDRASLNFSRLQIRKLPKRHRRPSRLCVRVLSGSRRPRYKL